MEKPKITMPDDDEINRTADEIVSMMEHSAGSSCTPTARADF